jgi:hypothetical protein
MKKFDASKHAPARDEEPDWGYTSHFITAHGRFEKFEDELPEVTHEGVRFRVIVDETPFEFTITRQALEDVNDSRGSYPDLLNMFIRHRERIETIALERIDAGARWPNLVIRMQDVQSLSHT